MVGDRSVVLLTDGSFAGRVIFHHLSRSVRVTPIVERSLSPWWVVRRRLHRHGARRVLGEVAFRALIVPLLGFEARDRLREIAEAGDLVHAPIPADRATHVRSVNDPAVVATIKELRPRVMVVAGTRVLSRAVLDASPGTICLNLHAGITPRYRGVHGAYWALVRGDVANCGVTIHVVDAGIDTGPIVSHVGVRPTSRDNFVTYFSLQLAAGLPLLSEAVHRALGGTLTTSRPSVTGSELWTHPTVTEYLQARIARGIR